MRHTRFLGITVLVNSAVCCSTGRRSGDSIFDTNCKVSWKARILQNGRSKEVASLIVSHTLKKNKELFKIISN